MVGYIIIFELIVFQRENRLKQSDLLALSDACGAFLCWVLPPLKIVTHVSV